MSDDGRDHSSENFGHDVGVRSTAWRRGEMVGTLTGAVKENPVSAALIGMGALWLFMGGGNMSLLGGHGRSSLLGTVASGAGSVAHGAGEAARGTAQAVGHMGSSGTTGVSTTVGGFAESVSEAASYMNEYMSEYVSGGAGGVDAESASRNPTFSGDQTGDGSFDRDSWGASRFSPLSGMRNNMQDLFERHPVALGVAGLALGAGIAASLPLSARERDTLGKANEALRSKLGEAAEQARHMASAVADEVQQGVRGQSGTPGHHGS